jgi:hypothetical protein
MICIVEEIVVMNVNVTMVIMSVNVTMVMILMMMRCGFLGGGVISCIDDLSGSL